MKTLFIIIAAFFLLCSTSISGFYHSPKQDPVDPTGTYQLKGVKRNNRIYGHHGEIRIRMIDSSTVAVSFYISKGYPGYQSGAFTETLHFEDNRIVYEPPGNTGCRICIRFFEETAVIEQWFTDPRSTCGFAEAVIASRTFQKVNNEEPLIQDLSGRN
ncbi:MAG: hypothetical protein H7Y27_13405 [Gemmatimonadaceae bacterium]|nr:hypothetical protein [Chitinophagaceae bacterium]